MTKDPFDPGLAAWLRDEAPPAADHHLVERIVASTRDMPQRGRWTLWAYSTGVPVGLSVATAAAVVAVALLLPNLLSPAPIGPSPSPSDGTPSEPPSAPESPDSTPAVTASPDEPSGADAWAVTEMPNPAPGSYAGGLPSDVVAGGPGLVAIGSARPCCADVTHEDDPWQAAVWTSTDGLDWELVPDLDTFGRAGLRAVAVDPQTGLMVATGYNVQPPTDDGSIGWSEEGTVWRSQNGIDWVGVQGVAGVFHDIVRAPWGWVIGGIVDGAPAVHISDDLDVWTTISLGGEGRLDHLAVGTNGRIVAVGCRGDGVAAPCNPVAWSSVDGEAWDESGIDALGISAVTSWLDGFVAIGMNETGAAMSWISTDGITWEADPGVDPPVTSMVAVVQVDGRLIAGGSAPNDDGVAGPRLWVSDDGLSWEPLAEPDVLPGQFSGYILALTALPDRVVALGEAWVSGGQPAAWTSER